MNSTPTKPTNNALIKPEPIVDGAKNLAGDLRHKVMSEIDALRGKVEDLEEMAEGKYAEAKSTVKRKIDAIQAGNS